MSKIELASIYQMPKSDAKSRLNTVLGSGLNKVLGEKAKQDVTLPLWRPEFFNLHQSSVFKKANAEEQHKIVQSSSRALLEEALFIEQYGMAFAAKMSLLAQTVEERMLYGLFAADETAHYFQISQYLPNQGQDAQPSDFHRLLSNLIEEGDRHSLVFIIQVVLEGWGLTHYRTLAQGVQSEDFAAVLKGIVRDEARHHGSGVVLCRERPLPEASRKYIESVLSTFLSMVQNGPQAVISAVDKHTGGLNRAEKIQLFKELDGQAKSQQRLNILKSLMGEDGFGAIVEHLESKGLYRALRPEDCL